MRVKGRTCIIDTSSRVCLTITPSKPIARALYHAGFTIIPVDCMSYWESLCRNLYYPPLISPRPWDNTLLAARPHEAVLNRQVNTGTPWGTIHRGHYFLPVVYGEIFGTCQYRLMRDDGLMVLIQCPGVPARSYLEPLMRAVERMRRDGHSIRLVVRGRRMYSWRTAERLAVRLAGIIERRGRLTLLVPYHGTPQLVLAAVSILDEEGYRGRIRLAPHGWEAEVHAPSRNRLKHAIDWMCSEGDDVACAASGIMHVPNFNVYFVKYRSQKALYTR